MDIFTDPDAPRCDDPGEASKLVSISTRRYCTVLARDNFARVMVRSIDNRLF